MGILIALPRIGALWAAHHPSGRTPLLWLI
jgi:hypothetical protein